MSVQICTRSPTLNWVTASIMAPPPAPARPALTPGPPAAPGPGPAPPGLGGDNTPGGSWPAPAPAPATPMGRMAPPTLVSTAGLKVQRLPEG